MSLSSVPVQDEIRKTKMCKFHLAGRCSRGRACTFAHDELELRPQLNLFRTRPCAAFMRRGSCNEGESCRFAHGKQELRQPAPLNGTGRRHNEARHSTATSSRQPQQVESISQDLLQALSNPTQNPLPGNAQVVAIMLQSPTGVAMSSTQQLAWPSSHALQNQHVSLAHSSAGNFVVAQSLDEFSPKPRAEAFATAPQPQVKCKSRGSQRALRRERFQLRREMERSMHAGNEGDGDTSARDLEVLGMVQDARECAQTSMKAMQSSREQAHLSFSGILPPRGSFNSFNSSAGGEELDFNFFDVRTAPNWEADMLAQSRLTFDHEHNDHVQPHREHDSQSSLVDRIDGMVDVQNEHVQPYAAEKQLSSDIDWIDGSAEISRGQNTFLYLAESPVKSSHRSPPIARSASGATDASAAAGAGCVAGLWQGGYLTQVVSKPTARTQ
eukprot:TRINITY_DN27312_c0_g1_i1.p1 TRINITY_DN27312_c0_g1~~TRINITY_DN27312_c0_g1_i1.p1  ORF type:complete len:441 (-),score=57.24 TRINITY_DN27312_c0_g1_i1:84-1406(-)